MWLSEASALAAEPLLQSLDRARLPGWRNCRPWARRTDLPLTASGDIFCSRAWGVRWPNQFMLPSIKTQVSTHFLPFPACLSSRRFWFFTTSLSLGSSSFSLSSSELPQLQVSWKCHRACYKAAWHPVKPVKRKTITQANTSTSHVSKHLIPQIAREAWPVYDLYGCIACCFNTQKTTKNNKNLFGVGKATGSVSPKLTEKGLRQSGPTTIPRTPTPTQYLAQPIASMRPRTLSLSNH